MNLLERGKKGFGVPNMWEEKGIKDNETYLDEKKHESFSHHCFPVGSLLQWPPNGRWFKRWCKRLSTTYPLSILSVSLSLSLSMSLSLALSLSLYCIVDDLPGVNIGFWRQIRRRCSPRSARSASHLFFLFFSTDLRCLIRFPSFFLSFFQRISDARPASHLFSLFFNGSQMLDPLPNTQSPISISSQSVVEEPEEKRNVPRIWWIYFLVDQAE